MEKITEWKPEQIIWSSSIDENIVNYWVIQDKLIPWLHFPNQELWGYFSNITLRSSWTWNQVITWVWFKPKWVRITGYVSSAAWWWFWGSSDWTNQNCSYIFYNSWWLLSWGNTNLIYLFNGSAQSIANLVSFNDDWFTINWTTVWISVSFIYECFR